MVRHHLLLPDVATRRDLDDPATIEAVAEAVGDLRTLGLLAALTEADSQATGPAAWGAWKADLVRDLVARVAHVLGGGTADEVRDDFPTAEHLELLRGGPAGAATATATGSPSSRPTGPACSAASPGAGAARPGGARRRRHQPRRDGPRGAPRRVELRAHHRAGTRSSPTSSGCSRAGSRSRPASPSGPGSTAAASQARAGARAAAGGGRQRASRDATVVEVHAVDAIGVLYRITRALAELDLNIVSAKVQTLGDRVVDAFYVRDMAGEKVTDPAALVEVERALLHELSS